MVGGRHQLLRASCSSKRKGLTKRLEGLRRADANACYIRAFGNFYAGFYLPIASFPAEWLLEILPTSPAATPTSAYWYANFSLVVRCSLPTGTPTSTDLNAHLRHILPSAQGPSLRPFRHHIPRYANYYRAAAPDSPYCGAWPHGGSHRAGSPHDELEFLAGETAAPEGEALLQSSP